MIDPTVLLIAYCALVVLGSLAGGWIPLAVELTHTRLQVCMSFVGGAMLGVGLLHLLPHAVMELGSIELPARWLLAGFLFMFFVERVFHFHQHVAPAVVQAAASEQIADQAACQAPHDHHHHHPTAAGMPRLSWGAALAGLSLHSMLDGVALAASVASGADGEGAGLAGAMVFLAVVLHKPFDSMTLGTLMAVAGQSPRARHLMNGLYGLTVPLGAAMFYLGVGFSGGSEHLLVGCALAFAAGTFVCISTSDLLPELQFHAHDRLKLSAALLLGLGLAAAIEAGHEHGAASHEEQVER